MLRVDIESDLVVGLLAEEDVPTGGATPSGASGARAEASGKAENGESKTPVQLEEPKILKIFTTAKNNIEAAKGLNCVMHTWRPAYSLCERCKRPFCYADLVKFEGNFYCLEDIDFVSGGKTAKTYAKNAFSYAAGLSFFINALIFTYFAYPTASFIVGDLLTSLSTSTLSLFVSNYFFQIINIILALASFLSGIIILATYKRGFQFGAVMGVFTLMMSSYEYMNSSTSYLLLATAVSIASIAFLIYSRMSSVSIKAEEHVEPNDIEWPKPEVF